MKPEYISLVEYAKMHGIHDAHARKLAAKGAYKTAQKIGRNWIIDKNEPHNALRKSVSKNSGKRKEDNN